MLTRNQKDEISAEIVRFNSLPERRRSGEEHEALIRLTEELMYTVPVEKGYLEKKEAAEFFLTEKKNAGRIMDAYRISQLPYSEYIAQVMRVRVRNYLIHKREAESDRERMDYDFVRNEPRSAVFDLESIYEDGTKEVGYPRKQDAPFATSLKESALLILHESEENRNADVDETLMIARMREKLDKRNKKLGLLAYLLKLPRGTGTNYVPYFSRILKVSEESLLEFLRLRDDETAYKEESRRRNLELSMKYYRLLLRLSTAYELASTAEERRKVLENETRLRRLHELKLNAVRRDNQGLSVRQISALLGLSRSTISDNMRCIETMLASSGAGDLPSDQV